MHPKQEIRRLNAIRAIAVMIVVLSHYSNETGLSGGLLGQGAGQIGVMLFFLLSAFLMAYLYFDVRPIKENLKQFAIARIARVIPLFLFVILLSYFLHQIPSFALKEYFYNIPDARSLISHFLLLSGTSVLWSIPPEIFFYALFAVLWSARKNVGNKIILVPTTLLVISVFFPPHKASETHIFGIYVKLSFLQVYPYFCAGFLLGCLYNKQKFFSVLSSHLWLASLLVIPLLYPNLLMKLTGITNGLWSDPRLLLVLSAIFFILVFLVPTGNIILENRVGDFLGKISYSIYLLHYPVLLGLKALGFAQGVVGLLLFCAATIVVSTISFSYLERPSRAWIKYQWTRKSDQ